jgi:hypothetical protein
VLLVLTGGGTTPAAVSAHVTVAGEFAIPLAMTLPSIPTRLTVYVALLSELTRTPNEPATGAGDGLCDVEAEGELVRDELAVGEGDFAELPGRLQAAENRASVASAAAHRVLSIIKRQRHFALRVTFPVRSCT